MVFFILFLSKEAIKNLHGMDSSIRDGQRVIFSKDSKWSPIIVWLTFDLLGGFSDSTSQPLHGCVNSKKITDSSRMREVKKYFVGFRNLAHIDYSISELNNVTM